MSHLAQFILDPLPLDINEPLDDSVVRKLRSFCVLIQIVKTTIGPP